MTRRILIFFLLSFFTACGKNDLLYERILRFEDQRFTADSLSVFLNSAEPKVRARAVEALGKLQDPKGFSTLLKYLNDADEGVRLEAAFALGQMADSLAEDSLIAHLNSEEILDVKIRIIEALGKIGTEKSFPVLFPLFRAKEAKLRAEAALAVGRMALRNLTNKALTDSLAALLKDPKSEVRWKACYSLSQVGKDLNPKMLQSATEDNDPRVRMHAVKALGKLKNLLMLETLGRVVRADSDWRVRVNAAKALGNFPLSLAANYLVLFDSNPHVRISIIGAIGASALQDSEKFNQYSRESNFAKNLLKEILTDDDSTAWTLPEQGTALVAYARLMGEEAIELVSEFMDHPNIKLRARAAEALGETRSKKVFTVLANNFNEDTILVKIAILEALPKLQDLRSQDVYLKALQDGDMVLTALAARALSEDTLRSKIYVQPIIDAYQRLPKPVDIESAQMIFHALGEIREPRAVPVLEQALKTKDKVLSKAAAEALGKITGEDYTSKIAKFTKPNFYFIYQDIQKIKGVKAIIQTSRGTLKFRLYTDSAPLTVLNFVRLAEKGFYDGLTFHRVVPNFVIQGGDPRGDSWGSPGYAIRSEFNKHPFVRGTVGMASAGKDTEGSQFFITHSPQPHLDGRYTVFGQVTSGMEVVDAIQEGDVIEVVEIKY
jgi:cyclophilin family peptidyl-prolyl cis-trans isomerase/HEAT repeat protein